MRKIVKVGILLGVMLLGLSGCNRKTELYESSDEVIADSGFDVKKDGFPFVNYNIYRNGSKNKGQCYGMAAVSQLYYRGLLPYAGEEIKERELPGIIGGDKISGTGYDLFAAYEGEINDDGYLKNDVPLSERFQSVGYEVITNKEGKWQRSIINPDNLIISDERRKQIEDNPLYFFETQKAPKGTKWNSGDGKSVVQLENIQMTLDNVNNAGKEIREEEQKKQYQLLCLINHWHATQRNDLYEEIDVITSTLKGDNPQKRNFDKLVNKINEGIPVIMSCEDHSINVIRIVKTQNNPLQYELIVYDNNYPDTEKKVTLKVKEKDISSFLEFNVIYLNNEYVYEFFDDEGLFVEAGEKIMPKFYYISSKVLEETMTQQSTVNKDTTEMPVSATVSPMFEPTRVPDVTPISEGTPKLFNEVVVGDEVLFGRYEQDADVTNGDEEIVWKVISVEDGKALLLSKYCLDNVKYNEVYTEVTWKDCTLRRWLNEEFYIQVFSEREKDYILISELTNEKDPRFKNNKDGENTEDKVFLLSLNEVERYLTTEEKCANATVYATTRGLSTAWKDKCCIWHIRTAAAGQWNVGAFHAEGHWTQHNVNREYGLRPAIWVDLEMIK